MERLLTLLLLLPFYAIGCLPSGQLVARKFGFKIEEHGSGNVGAANVARTAGARAGIITLALDVCKGAAAVLLARAFGAESGFTAMAAFAAVAGQCFSLPGRLRGGKGVATSLGAMLCLSPLLAFFSLGIFAFTFWAVRITSLASLTAVALAPVLSLLSGNPDHISFALMAMALLVVYRHRENLIRLSEGREPKFQVAQKR